MSARYVLIQARLATEPIGPEEHASFAAIMGVPVGDIECVSALVDPLDPNAIMDRYDAVLVGGSGKFSVTDSDPWLRNFFDLLGAVADRDFPTFASCFGFQGLCVALGAPVRTDTERAEVGTYWLQPTEHAAEDPVFGDLPAPFPAQLGHKDRAFQLPSDATWLASSERCPYQAMRLGTRVYATQFHPELDAASNRRRFLQYWNEYAHAFGEEGAKRILDGFQASPHASALLRRFHQQIPAR